MTGAGSDDTTYEKNSGGHQQDIYLEEISIKTGKRVFPPVNHDYDRRQEDSKAEEEEELLSLVGDRIKEGKSIVTLTNAISPEEINFLVESSLAAATKQKTKKKNDHDDNDTTGADADADDTDTTTTEFELLDDGVVGNAYVRLSTIAAARRENRPIETDALPEPISSKLEEIIYRIFHFLDDNSWSPNFKSSLFGFDAADNNDIVKDKITKTKTTTTTTTGKNDSPTGAKDDDIDDNLSDGSTTATTTTTTTTTTSLVELFQNNEISWSIREPAINIYQAPHGHFGMHKDNNDLTILMPLSDPQTGAFTGGGTAFWSQSYPVEGMHDPSLIMTPPAGTAMLFGGKVSHKGMHIKSGTRLVFVASFSRPSYGNERDRSSSWRLD